MVSKSDVGSFWNSSLRFKSELFIDLSYFSLNYQKTVFECIQEDFRAEFSSHKCSTESKMSSSSSSLIISTDSSFLSLLSVSGDVLLSVLSTCLEASSLGLVAFLFGRDCVLLSTPISSFDGHTASVLFSLIILYSTGNSYLAKALYKVPFASTTPVVM